MDGSKRQLDIKVNSNIVFKEIERELYTVLKDKFGKYGVGASISETYVMENYCTSEKVSIIYSNGRTGYNFELNEKTESRNKFEIGKGKYTVIYEELWSGKTKEFVGVCENFCAAVGKSAFWNMEKEQMLLIDYKDIIGLFPLEDE